MDASSSASGVVEILSEQFQLHRGDLLLLIPDPMSADEARVLLVIGVRGDGLDYAELDRTCVARQSPYQYLTGIA